MDKELAVIGAGMIAEAIVRGVLRGKRYQANQIIAADVSEARREVFSTQLRTAVTAENTEAAAQAGVLLLSVKPYQMEAALAGLGAVMRKDALVISVAAGISTAFIAKHLGGATNWRVVRAMPNTPMLVGEGMVAIAAGSHATAQDMLLAKNIFSAAADVVEVTEDRIDAVTAISGSGPAYFFFLVEQMIRAGVELGLTQEQAAQLATKTASGAAKMMLAGESPTELRRRVTTPNGTTHAAITHMESNNWPIITVEALKAAARRSREMGK